MRQSPIPVGPLIHSAVFLAFLIFAIGGCRDQQSSTNHARNADSKPLSTQSSLDRGSESPRDNLDVSASEQPRAAEAGDWFEDVRHRTGVDFSFRSGRESGQYTMLEVFGGGVGLFDFDCDGDIDIFFPAGGAISSATEVSGRSVALFRNDGGWRFTNVTVGSGLDVAIDYSHGCTVGDVNRDGVLDTVVNLGKELDVAGMTLGGNSEPSRGRLRSLAKLSSDPGIQIGEDFVDGLVLDHILVGIRQEPVLSQVTGRGEQREPQ